MTPLPTFAEQRQSWSSPPVDDIGYIPATELLALNDSEFVATMTAAIANRYGGWRNFRGRWMDFFGAHSTHGKVVLDYGSGIGIEALQYTVLANEVWAADVVEENLKVVERLFSHSENAALAGTLLIGENAPRLTRNGVPFDADDYFDVIHCAGVLHHIPNAREVVEEMHRWLRPSGELRLMLYSDEAWRMATGKRPIRDVPTHEHPGFETFVRHWDAVGFYADWYDRLKLQESFGEWFTVRAYQPLTRTGEYVGARLVRR